jgi:flagellar biosynthesis/type III secretory pathway protein FliH
LNLQEIAHKVLSKIDLIKEGTQTGRYKQMSIDKKNKEQTATEVSEMAKKESQLEVSTDPYARGYHAGHIAGHEEGYDDGYTNGKEDVHKKQTNTGYSNDFNVGYTEGHKDGIFHAEENQRKKEFFEKNPPMLASILYILENTPELLEALTLVNYVYDNKDKYKEE